MLNEIRRAILEREYQRSQRDLSDMSTREIKWRLSRIAPELKEKINEFGTYKANFSDYADDLYKQRTVYAYMNELLKRNKVNREYVRNDGMKAGLAAIILLLSTFLGVGYSNRSEKEKVTISTDGIVTYSNGMSTSAFSINDLQDFFGYNSEEHKNVDISNFLGDCLSGYDNMFFSTYREETMYEKAYKDGCSILKYSGVMKLDGIRGTNFRMKNMNLEDWKIFNLFVDNNDIQSLCRIFVLGNIVEKNDMEKSDVFYKSIYYIENGEKIYFNSKEELIKYAQFNSLEEYNEFMMEVIYTLNGNVFYYSEPSDEITYSETVIAKSM